MMVLVLVSYLFNARIGAVKALDDLRAPFNKSGQQQSDEMMWEAQFSDEKYEHAIVSDHHMHMLMFLCFAFNIRSNLFLIMISCDFLLHSIDCQLDQGTIAG